jgi:hypothetical protein
MIIQLEDLAAKRAKSAEGLVISDHSLDLAKFSGSELVITGKGSRGLVFKNLRGVEVTTKDCIIDMAGTGVILKVDGTSDDFKLNGSTSTKLLAKAGNLASQCIYIQGTWSNVIIGNFDIDQRRDNKTGTTTTGACVQLAGVLKADHRLGKVTFYGTTIRNAGDEGFYCNHFEKGSGYAPGDDLYVEAVNVLSSGRDFFQEWGFDNVTFKRCYGENGMKEGDANHMSCFSINGDTESLLIENCEFKNIAQLLYSGKPSTGKSIKALIKGVVYDQGVHAGARSNSSVYVKGPGTYRFEDCYINAPYVKVAVFSADGCVIEVLKDCQITGPALYRDPFNGGSYKEITPDPIITKTTGEITIETTTTYEGVVTTKYFLPSGQELKP